MKAKKTSTLHGSILIVISCFMVICQASAQSWSNNVGGNSNDYWVVNNNSSNHWATLRLQASTNKAWSIANYGDFIWAYTTSSDYEDLGFEKMRLTTAGKLGIGTNAPAATFHVKGNGGNQIIAEPLATTAEDAVVKIRGHRNGSISNNQSQLLFQNYDNDLSGTNTLGRIAGKVTDHGNNIGDMVFYNYADGNTATETMRLTGNGTIGIGTTTPSATLDVNGTGHFSGEVGIGTTSPSDRLTVYDGELTLQTDDNSQDQSMLFQNSGGSYTWRIYRTDIGNNQADLKFASGLNPDYNGLTDRMIIKNNGSVGIGTNSPAEKLEVSGTVKATSFTSSAASFPDYVFAEDYKITPLAELETYVKTNKHLPNMPSEKEVVEQGLNLPEVVTKSVENIETIYLHLIRMEKEIKALKQENAALKQQLKNDR